MIRLLILFILVCVYIVVLETRDHLIEWHTEWVKCCKYSDISKDTRPKIPDCGMSTWDEIRGECNDNSR